MFVKLTSSWHARWCTWNFHDGKTCRNLCKTWCKLFLHLHHVQRNFLGLTLISVHMHRLKVWLKFFNKHGTSIIFCFSSFYIVWLVITNLKKFLLAKAHSNAVSIKNDTCLPRKCLSWSFMKLFSLEAHWAIDNRPYRFLIITLWFVR